VRFRVTRRISVPAVLPWAPLLGLALITCVFSFRFARVDASDNHRSNILPVHTTATVARDAANLSNIEVGLRADANGNLAQLTLGQTNLGHDDAAFDRLASQIRAIIGKPGTPLSKPVEVEIDADDALHYKYVIRAVSKCSGEIDPQTGRLVRYVEKIKFAPPHKPRS